MEPDNSLDSLKIFAVSQAFSPADLAAVDTCQPVSTADQVRAVGVAAISNILLNAAVSSASSALSARISYEDYWEEVCALLPGMSKANDSDFMLQVGGWLNFVPVFEDAGWSITRGDGYLIFDTKE